MRRPTSEWTQWALVGLVFVLLLVPSLETGGTFVRPPGAAGSPATPMGPPSGVGRWAGGLSVTPVRASFAPSGRGGSAQPLLAAPFHAAPTWPGWNWTSGRPSPNLRPDWAATVSLLSPQCNVSSSLWAWLAYDPLDSSFWVASESSCVEVISSPGLNVTATYPVGQDPFGVAVDGVTGDVYVTNSGSDNVTVINGSSGVTVANLAVGTRPYGVAYDPTTQEIFVANGGSDNVTIIAGSNSTVIGSVGVGTTPIGLAVDPTTGQLFVANNGSANVSVVAVSNATVVATLDVGQNPYGVALDNASGQVYVSNRGSNSVSVVDPWNDSVAVTIGTGDGMSPEGVAYNPVNRLVWVAADFYTVLINTTSQSVLGYLTTDPSGVAVDPTNGLVCATNTANATLRCMQYPSPIFPSATLEFVDPGLVPPVNWSVTLYWPGYYHSTAWNGSYGSTNAVSFEIFAGAAANNYTYVIPPAGGYYPAVPTGTLSIATNTQVNVTFVPASATYPVTFTESGLPAGSSWTVTLGGVANRTDTNSSGFREPNGTYAFSVDPVPGYEAAPFTGSLLVAGAGVMVPIVFSSTPPPAPNLTVNFTETGLPNGTRWEVGVNGVVRSAVVPWIDFSLPPGAYGYQVYPAGNFLPAAPSVGFFNLTTANLSLPVGFVPVYTLEFVESGLTPGTDWYLTVDSLTESTIGSVIRVDLAAGTHTFAVAAVPGYTASPSSGTIRLTGNTTLPIVFSIGSASDLYYPVRLSELGLPPQTEWCAYVNGSMLCSSGTFVATELPNGSVYGFSVPPVSGYVASPSNGSFSVEGQAVNFTVVFSPEAGVVPPPTGSASEGALYVGLGGGLLVGAAIGVVVGYVLARRSRRP